MAAEGGNGFAAKTNHLGSVPGAWDGRRELLYVVLCFRHVLWCMSVHAQTVHIIFLNEKLKISNAKPCLRVIIEKHR